MLNRFLSKEPSISIRHRKNWKKRSQFFFFIFLIGKQIKTIIYIFIFFILLFSFFSIYIYFFFLYGFPFVAMPNHRIFLLIFTNKKLNKTINTSNTHSHTNCFTRVNILIMRNIIVLHDPPPPTKLFSPIRFSN